MKKGNSPIMAQLEKIFRHTRAGSFGTRARYKSSCRNFVQFLDFKFKMKNLNNLHDKHLAAYVRYRQAKEVAPKTMKNDLGAIRYMHDMLPNPKYKLSENQELQRIYSLSLDKTPAVKGNRAWTREEYEKMKALALEKALIGTKTAKDIHDILAICRTMGFRITEAVAMTRSQAEQALETGKYQIKNEAKNGKWRQVPVSPEVRKILETRLNETSRGGYFFIEEDEKTHQAVNRMEKFLYNNRAEIETEEGVQLRTWFKYGKTHINEITFHGLRYNYVQERVQQEIEKGFSLDQAALRVTQEVGHERIDVIKIYLAGKEFINKDDDIEDKDINKSNYEDSEEDNKKPPLK